MLKAIANVERLNGRGPLFLFGLSSGNLAKLREGKPIHIKLAEMLAAAPADLGLHDAEILIMWGETEEKMMRELAPFIGPGTKVHVDPDIDKNAQEG